MLSLKEEISLKSIDFDKKAKDRKREQTSEAVRNSLYNSHS
jgi:hypothetical protein